MSTAKMVFHGSDIEKICEVYQLKSEEIVKFGANVTAEPKFKNESIPPITTNTPPVSEEPSGDKSSRTPNVKTGDDTNVIMWLSLMGISLIIFSKCKRKVHK